MNKTFLKQLSFFTSINIPKYIEVNIQSVALKHLNLPDMGKLRDRMEGQTYYDKLLIDIKAEFAFEKTIGIRTFDWKKRMLKNYCRRKYIFNEKELYLVTFEKEDLPHINVADIGNYIFIYVNVEKKAFLSGLANKNLIKNIVTNQKKSQIIEISDFKNFIEFSSYEDLIKKME